MTNTMAEATMMKAWSPASYHWFKFSVAGRNYQYAYMRKFQGGGWNVARQTDVAIHTCEGRDGMYSLESPPVMGSVPLNWAGGPIHA